MAEGSSPVARHSSLLVTSVYLHPTDEDLARSVQKIRC